MATPALNDGLTAQLDETARSWLQSARDEVQKDPARLPVLFPQLPRRLGRKAFTSGIVQMDGSRIDLGAWRSCDAGALMLLLEARPTAEVLLDLYHHGDMEEKAMLMRSAAVLPLGTWTTDLLGEAQRTNTVNLFEAMVCDSDLLCRALASEELPDFGQEDFNRVLLKQAFMGLPLARVLGAEAAANAELSRMLQDLATEREAAGRGVWPDTNTMIARAPTAGSIGRLAGALEHGDDQHRLAAARGLQHCDHPLLREVAAARLEREPRESIRKALSEALER